MRLIVTIACADEARRAKSKFSRRVNLRVFPHNPSIRDIASTSQLRNKRPFPTARRTVKVTYAVAA
jgi:hypothetical protein